MRPPCRPGIATCAISPSLPDPCCRPPNLCLELGNFGKTHPRDGVGWRDRRNRQRRSEIQVRRLLTFILDGKASLPEISDSEKSWARSYVSGPTTEEKSFSRSLVRLPYVGPNTDVQVL